MSFWNVADQAQPSLNERISMGHKAANGASAASSQMRAGNAPVPDPINSIGHGKLQDLYYHFLTHFNEGLPPYGTRERDKALRRVLRDSSNMLSGIVYGEAVRARNMEWQLSIDDPTTGEISAEELRRWRDILKAANFGDGFAQFVQDFALDYLSQNNGAFVEVIVENGRGREHLPLEDKDDVIGLATIDSGQCYRTFDPQWPVVYENPWTGEYTIYHYTKVRAKAQFKQNQEMLRGMGVCALDRAYSAALLVREAHIYMLEKISGAEPEVIFVSGIGHHTLRRALEAGEQEARVKGATRYKGVTFVSPPNIGPNFPEIKTEVVGLKSVPTGWDHGNEVMLAVYKIALAFGIDAREIWAATQTGATKADAEVQHRKASGKGRIELSALLQNLINEILPDGITFLFTDEDAMVQKFNEQTRSARAMRFSTYVQSNILSPEAAQRHLAAHGDIDRLLFSQTMDSDISSTPTDDVSVAGEVSETDDNSEAEESAKGGQKQLSETADFFRQRLTALVGQADRMGFFEFVGEMDTLIREFGREAFIEGLNTFSDEQLSDVPSRYRAVFDQAVSNHQFHVTRFAQAVFDPERAAEVDTRLDLWVSKGMGEFHQLGSVAGAANVLLEWNLGPTEHCTTCLAAAGIAKTGADWLRSGIYPRSSALECGGYRCQCYFTRAEAEAGDMSDIPTFGSGISADPRPGLLGRFTEFIRQLFGGT